MEGVLNRTIRKVTEDIDNIAGAGAVSVAGKIWTARSTGGEPIPAGELVRADRIEGVKLYVHMVREEQSAGPAEK